MKGAGREPIETAPVEITPVEIVPVGEPGAALVAGLMAKSVDEVWSEREIGRILALPGARGFVAAQKRADGARAAGSPVAESPVAESPAAESGGPPEPLGFALVLAAAGECELLSIGVVPTARRRGVARRLLAAAIAAAQELGAARMVLEVAADNGPARAFYAVTGFAAAGRRPGYYRSRPGPPRDALILERLL